MTCLVLIPVIYFLIQYTVMWEDWVELFILLLALPIGYFLAPFTTQKKVKGYRNKLQAQYESNVKQTDPLIATIEKYVGTWALVIVLIIGFTLTMAYIDGRAHAMGQRDFLVSSTNENSVVLRVYGGNLICAPLDVKDKETSTAFFVIKLDDEPRPVLFLTSVGPLRVKGPYLPSELP